MVYILSIWQISASRGEWWSLVFFSVEARSPTGELSWSCLVHNLHQQDVRDCCRKHLPSVHSYADDTQLYVAFSPNQPGDDEAALKAMSACIRDLRDGMIRDRLKLNEDKTEVILIGTRQQLAKLNVTSIAVGDETIEAKPSVRNLESWFDSQLSMLTHISKVCGAAFYRLHSISRTRKFLSPDDTKSMHL